MSDDAHHDWLNLEAYLALEGLRTLIPDRLIALLRSDAPIESEVRKKIADCLAKHPDEPGVRLEVCGTGKGNRDLPAELIQTRRRWLIAGEQIEKLEAEGMSIYEAKTKVTSLYDTDGSIFGYSPTQAAEAWAYFRSFRKFEQDNLLQGTRGAASHYIMMTIMRDRPDLAEVSG